MSVSGREIFSSAYGPMDVDVAAEADHATPFTDAPQSRVSSVFGALDTIMYARPRGSLYGAIRFNESMARFVLSEHPAPDAVFLASLKRRSVPLEDESRRQPWERTVNHAVMGFDKPANSLFLPPEFFAVNCIWCAAWVEGALLRGNGQSTGPVVTTVGTPVAFASIPDAGSFCLFYFEPALYNFPLWHNVEFGDGQSASLEGPQFPTAAPAYTSHAYEAEGLYTASTTIGCSVDNCEHSRIDTIQIQVIQSEPPPVCEDPYVWHNARWTHDIGPQVSKSGALASGSVSITSNIYAQIAVHYDRFEGWVNGLWNKNVSGAGVNLDVSTSLSRVQFPELADVSLTIDLIPPGPVTPENCGTHGQGPSGTHAIIVRDDGSTVSTCPEAATAAHEFGHHVGFADAYVQPPPTTLHCDQADVMSWGDQVQYYHGRILWERY